MFAPVLRFTLAALLMVLSPALAQSLDEESDADTGSSAALVARLDEQFAAIERILPTLRHVTVSTDENGTRLTSEAWFVPGDSVETPVKVILAEANGDERREMAFWLDQGHLFRVQELISTGAERTESRRHYDGPRLASVQSRVTSVATSPANPAPFVPAELPADSEQEGFTLEEIALETASQLSPVTITNRPVR